jgi:gas vesicle protein
MKSVRFTHRGLLLAGVFSGALLVVPTVTFADSDDTHPGVTQEKVDNAHDRLMDRKADIRDRKLDAKDQLHDKFKDKKEDIRDRMQNASGERREEMKEHLTNVKDHFQDRKEAIKDRAQESRENARDRFRDRDERSEHGGLEKTSDVHRDSKVHPRPAPEPDDQH